MSPLKACLCLLAVLFCVASPTTAQGPRFPMPERLERATEADDQGLQQWAEWPAPDCQSCKGSGKTQCVTCARFSPDAEDCPECGRKEKNGEIYAAPCRACAGEGKMPDPLERAPCVGCMGAGKLICTVCGGGGRLKVGAAKRWSDCPSCRGDGALECGGCEGKRLMTCLDLKDGLKAAPLDKLQKAKEDLDATLAAFEKFTPIGGVKARKAVKELGNSYSEGKKLHDAFKRMPKSSKDFMNKIFAGKQFVGAEEDELEAFKMLKENALYYLKHQKRMLELAIKRAELNEKNAK